MKLSMLLEGYSSAVEAVKVVTSFEAGLYLSLLIRDLEVVKTEYNKKQNALIEKYGRAPDKTKEEEKNINAEKFIPPNTPEFKEFSKEYEELMAKDIKFEFKALDAKMFKDEKIPGNYVYGLTPFFALTENESSVEKKSDAPVEKPHRVK